MIPILDIILFVLWKHVFGVFTICTTRCGFVNSVFGFAARKASRHQLYKHVNAHVYLDVLAYYAKQRPSRCGSPWAWRWAVCVAHFRIPRFGKSKLDLANRDIMLFRVWKHIFTFTLISCTVKVAFGWWLYLYAAQLIPLHVMLFLYSSLIIGITWSAHRM